MQIISVMNYKGGVGKTTVTTNLATGLALKGKKILIIDIDAQASLTFSFITPEEWDDSLKDRKTIKNWFDAISKETDPVSLTSLITKPTIVNNVLRSLNASGSVDIISSHLGLINVDLELATLLGGANISQTKAKYIKVHGRLRTEIGYLASSQYDVVLIDCPPNFNIVTKNAIIASDKILIPTKPDYLSTLGIDYLQKSVSTLVSEYNDFMQIDGIAGNKIDPKFLGIVFTMVQEYASDAISKQKQYMAQIRRTSLRVFSAYFKENKSIFADAPLNGIPVILNNYSNNSHSSVVSEISKFNDEFLKISGV